MDIFFKSMGLVFLVIILMALVGALILIRKWRKFKNKIQSMDQESLPVSHIHLNEDPEPEWPGKEEVKPLIKRLLRSGFIKGKAYLIEEMPAVRLIGLFHPKMALCAVIYDHDDVGHWVDLCLQYQDGQELTISNAPMGQEIDHRPECTKIFLPGAPLEELVAALNRNIQKKPKVMIDDSSFRQVFEESYAKDMEWRAGKGGVTQEEVDRVAANMDRDFSPKDLKKAHATIKLKEIYQWHEECLREFGQTSSNFREDWKNNHGELIVVIDSAAPDVFLQYLTNFMRFTDRQIAQFKKLAEKSESSGELFLRINQSLSPALRAQKLGTVDRPVAAEIYLTPQDQKK